MAGPPRLAQSVLRVRHANDATSSEPGCRVSRRSRHHGGSEKARLKSARRCAASVAHFSSLGLVSGGLRKQAASLFLLKHHASESLPGVGRAPDRSRSKSPAPSTDSNSSANTINETAHSGIADRRYESQASGASHKKANLPFPLGRSSCHTL